MGRTKLKEENLQSASARVATVDNDTDSAPLQRKRGRPRKLPKDESANEKHKLDTVNTDLIQASPSEAAIKSVRSLKSEESSELSAETNGIIGGGSLVEPAKLRSMKRGRRKGEPRRAAGVNGK